jgi:hypothetical protein
MGHAPAQVSRLKVPFNDEIFSRKLATLEASVYKNYAYVKLEA